MLGFCFCWGCRTAVTPAGYAFAIWGPIYLAGAGFAAYTASNPEFAEKIGPMMTTNLVLNAVWIPLFCADQKWPALAVIWVMLGSSTIVWQTVGAPSGPASSALEWFAVRPFTSLYTAWLTVASTVSIATTLTSKSRPHANFLGLSPQTWAKIVLPTAAAILAGLGVAHGDPAMPGVAAWALLAIGAKQRTDKTHPGGESVADVATALGWGSAAIAAGILGYVLYSGQTWWL
jgi:hypothetical protein